MKRTVKVSRRNLIEPIEGNKGVAGRKVGRQGRRETAHPQQTIHVHTVVNDPPIRSKKKTKRTSGSIIWDSDPVHRARHPERRSKCSVPSRGVLSKRYGNQ